MSTTSLKITSFIDTYIICRFDIQHKIIIDNGTYFKNQHMRAFHNGYNIQHSFSTPYYPQGYG